MWLHPVISGSVMLAVGWLLTLPHECRENRRWKILISLPFAIVIGESYRTLMFGYFGAFSALFLAHVWKGNIGWLAANVLTNIMTNASDTLAPDFRRARIEYRDGNLKEALTLAERELNKNPYDVEGLIFTAQMLTANGDPEKALAALNRALAAPNATPAQVSRADEAAHQVRQILDLRLQLAQKIA